ncbi:uncharacterized protein TRAVEDRAFT_56601 [Trametes versicolor FP-101664 SS1]|uniref:uncharacterized protein n=1 Tax=Trametes versicolor (strain FP-101664) TaxID=717944 RepID=UPI00046214DF|nr:uncharacterized protein TRAVEDRAFT_56601 [Trametes versicolor FP-101664 SS1]EIW61231.1 hypothetical protein TRAVEDRAFT_56601 [Trametes versicolor FP-101664 SS1]
MSGEEDWEELLRNHPVFSLPKSVSGPRGKGEESLNLSLSSLPDFVNLDPIDDKPTPSGRRQAVAIKDADLIVAVGTEVRITSLGDSKGARNSSEKFYKILHTPNLQFEIHQVALNPSGKLLAVAGAFQVAVIVLPRTGFNKLVTATVDCKSIQIGQYYHAADNSAPVAKIDWHPWGQGGSTLLVMTVDGKLREYDISADADEPQQTLSFVPEKKRNTFDAEDAAEREVASFTFGKGKADWGPLTVYAAMRSGDVYAISPYMPKNASVPSTYVHALECYVAAKQEFLSASTGGDSGTSDGLTTVYDYQRKYVNALLKQLPPGTAWPATTRLVPMHPPTTIKNTPARQGPFLLQPSPRNLAGSDGGDATDIVYLSFGDDAAEESEGETERLGLVLLSFQDGKVDLLLDVEKVEARWEMKQKTSNELPMLATYESIDLGIVSTLKSASTSQRGQSLLELVQGNHPVFLADPIHDDTIYVYHAFGVHVLQLEPLLKGLAIALRDTNDEANSDAGSLEATLDKVAQADVLPILLTFSVEQQSSSPVVGVAVPNDVYLTYSIFILTSAMRMSVFPLNLRSESPYSPEPEPSPSVATPGSLPDLPPAPSHPGPSTAPKALLAPPEAPPAYVSLLEEEPFKIPQAIARTTGLPPNPRLSLPNNPAITKGEFMITPDTLRYLGTVVEHFSAQIHDVQLAHRAAEARASLQEQEFKRQRAKCAALLESARGLGGAEGAQRERLARVQETQRALLARLDRTLQGLMAKASPELSENETKWFEELRRMKAEVVGAGKFDDRALVARAKLLRREVDRLLPYLKELREKEETRQKSLVASREALGLSQAFELGKRSTEERTRITLMEAEILRLANVLDVTLGRPPAVQTKDGEAQAK